jgi:hypothetical protein
MGQSHWASNLGEEDERGPASFARGCVVGGAIESGDVKPIAVHDFRRLERRVL